MQIAAPGIIQGAAVDRVCRPVARGQLPWLTEMAQAFALWGMGRMTTQHSFIFAQRHHRRRTFSRDRDRGHGCNFYCAFP